MNSIHSTNFFDFNSWAVKSTDCKRKGAENLQAIFSHASRIAKGVFLERWDERSIRRLDEVDTFLDRWMPDWLLQKKIDSLAQHIQTRFAPLQKFNTWLRAQGNGNWHQKCAVFLAKLPLRVSYNIIHLIYNVIKAISYTTVHPLKSLNHIAKQCIALARALTQPETWAKIGSGMVGAGLGHALVMNHPVSVPAIGIGSALYVAGLSVGALKTVILAEKGQKMEEAVRHLSQQLIATPESALTGFCMGILFGGIQRACARGQKMQVKGPKSIRTIDEAKTFANQFIKKNQLPPYQSVHFDANGHVIIQWRCDYVYIDARYPKIFEDMTNLESPSDFRIVVSPDVSSGYVYVDLYHTLFADHSSYVLSLKDAGLIL